MDFLKKKKKFFFLGGGGDIHKINLGRTCFYRVSRKLETNKIFFRPHRHVHDSLDLIIRSCQNHARLSSRFNLFAVINMIKTAYV